MAPARYKTAISCAAQPALIDKMLRMKE